MTTEPTDPLAGIPETDAQKIIRAAEDAEASAVIDENLDPSKARPEGEAYQGALAAGAAAYRAKHVDPRGAKGEPSDDMAVARRMPTAALVAVLAERGAPGDVSAEDLEAVQGLQDQESVSAFMATWRARHGRTSTMSVCGNPQSAWEFYAAMQTIVPRLAREVVILRALAAHVVPCGHDLADIVYGGPDLNGLPAIAQCGQCLANRQAAKAALPRTQAMSTLSALRVAISNPPDGDDDAWRAQMMRAFRAHESALAGTRPLDAPPMEAP